MPNPPRVFTIPASAPFLPTLIKALIDGRLVDGFAPGADPLALATATLYLPTRRAARLARDVFRDVLGSEAAILPRIVAIGDVDEDEIAFDEAGRGDFGASLDVPEALGGLQRRLLLATQVTTWAKALAPSKKGEAPLVADNPAAALALADDLARLMDDLATRQVPFAQLDALVPREVDNYWQVTLRFLKIARETWPSILQEEGKIEPAARRDRLIKAEAERLARSKGPVVAAGSTGSIPATAELLATIAGLAQGAMVLPGLDTDLDPDSWESIGGDIEQDLPPAAGHAQFAMHGLLKRIGIARDAVTVLAEPAAHGRERIVSEALRPAATTQVWQEKLAAPDFARQADMALSSISVIEAANAEEEALAAAVALREAVETPGMTAALATPDRALARRVLAALARWNVAVNDSGGDALPDTPAGVFARLAADAALGGLAPVTLLALLKHPLLRLGAEENAQADAVAALELAVLRGPRPKPGTEGLIQALKNFRSQRGTLYRSDPRKQLSDAELDSADELARRLAAALAPLEKLPRITASFPEIAICHRDAIEELSTGKDGKAAAFAGSDGNALVLAFNEIAQHAAAASFGMTLADYPDFFRAAISDRVVRRPDRPGTRVHIYGLLEARLQNVDRLVLGGLVEGVWPPETRSDPWLNRPMRHELGLDLPERRIGLSAHDFAQSLGAKEAILTRAAKLSGAPTVASRFTQRLQAVAGKERWQQALARGEKYLHWARALDQPEMTPKAALRPQPKPAVDLRPKSLSVTEIELLLRDPYSIYARHVLRLQPLDAVDTPPGARDRGTVIHEAIGAFTERYRDALPADPLEELLRLGQEGFARLEDFPDARAFWWPRFQRVARWFVDFEKERRENIGRLHAEVRATHEIQLGDKVFKLNTRADRIEQIDDGRYAIIDYKTGRAPSSKQVKSGLSPQLTLEGAILRKGGFDGIPEGASIAKYLYVELRGGEPAGEQKIVDMDKTTPDIEADNALRKLTAVLVRFTDPDTGYASRERPMFMGRSGGDYDHLARVREWSLSGGVADEEGDVE
ncbi:MAG TPA: double-strand break repair protein AddB [Xanthobacteraceae bacterium]|nr:double-strand break repair protein AddB [Xanthobacteraceae bacterium]